MPLLAYLDLILEYSGNTDCKKENYFNYILYKIIVSLEDYYLQGCDTDVSMEHTATIFRAGKQAKQATSKIISLLLSSFHFCNYGPFQGHN
jgi:hypothetical protein